MLTWFTAQSTEAVEYANCISAEDKDSHPTTNVLIWHQTIEGRGFSLGDLGNVEFPFIAIAFRSILTGSDSTCLGPIYETNGTNYVCEKMPDVNCECYIAILETI